MEGLGLFNAWIGARRDPDEDLFMFVKRGYQVPTGMWQGGEPSDKGDCVLLNMITRQIHVAACDSGCNFICEKY